MAEKSFDLVVVGELNPDLILSGDVQPEFGQVEKLVEAADLTIGSSSAIFACGAARLGLRVAFVGKVGRDLFGRFMLDALRSYQIDTRGVLVDEHAPTGLSVILSTGEDRAILTFPGCIPRLRFDEIRPEWIGQARHLHLGSYFIQKDLRPQAPALFSLARQQGLTTSLDTNYDPTEHWEGVDQLLPLVDIFLPNAVECRAISGVRDVKQGARLLAQTAGMVAVKLGTGGSLLQQGDRTYRAASLPVQVTDTVGAGDSFDAGFVYGFLAGWDLPRALRLAAACGSLSTRLAGGTAAQPTLEEALQYAGS